MDDSSDSHSSPDVEPAAPPPRPDPPQPAQTLPQAPEPKPVTWVPGYWEPRVLFVDDDPVVRVAAEHLLRKLGLEVDIAADGLAGVRMSAAWPYAAIFMDCQMPEVDGYSSTREIRTQDRFDQGPPVIAVTSRPRHVCLAAGMDHHIAKPLRIDVLRADCEMLGLLPAADAAGEQASVPEPLPAMPPVSAVPGRSSQQVAAGALEFVERSLRQLPKLWRAANARDADALRRVAVELRQRASSAGAERVAELCDRMAQAAEQKGAATAAAYEPLIREAIRETAAAALALGSEEMPRAAGAAGAATAGEPAAPQSRGGPAAAPPGPVRVAIADDDPLARMAIEAMLKRSEGVELVGSAADAQEIVELVAAARPDVAVVDFIMPGGGGPEAARQIRERSPGTRVVALTASEEAQTYLEMLRAGASGLLVKGGSAERLAEVIRRVADR